MKGVTMYKEVRSLVSQAMSYRAIARALGIDPRTVKKLASLSLEEAGQCFEQGVKRKSGFEIAEDFILSKLQSYPDIRSSNLYHQVRERFPQITLGERSFRNYFRKLKSQHPIPAKQRRIFEPVVWWEPGQFMQVDLGEKSIVLADQKRMKVYFISFVLCYCKVMYIHYSTKAYNTDLFIKAHVEAFQFFGGLPHVGIYDQTKLVAIAEEYREVLYNEKFQLFFLRHGFHAEVCEGYDPESKGMVEKSVDYIKESFLYGREFNGVDDLRRQSNEWLKKVANIRIHQTTRQRPIELLEEERSYLLPLGRDLYPAYVRKVDKTGLINYQGRCYSVPYRYQQKEVLIREFDGVLHIYDSQSQELVAEWDTKHSLRRINKSPNHYIDYERTTEDELTLSIELFSRRGLEHFAPIIRQAGENNPKHPRDQYRGMRSLLNKYKTDIWLSVYNQIASLPIVSCSRIRRLLEAAYARQEAIETRLAIPNNSKTTISKNSFRDLNYYNQVIREQEHD